MSGSGGSKRAMTSRQEPTGTEDTVRDALSVSGKLDISPRVSTFYHQTDGMLAVTLGAIRYAKAMRGDGDGNDGMGAYTR